jgi:hypothetical protein
MDKESGIKGVVPWLGVSMRLRLVVSGNNR